MIVSSYEMAGLAKRGGGRTMCKTPLSEPAIVTSVNHHKLQIQFSDGTKREVHLENVLQVPKGYHDHEHSNFAPGPGEDVLPEVPVTGRPGAPAQDPGSVAPRSPGMMIEDDGGAVRAHDEEVQK